MRMHGSSKEKRRRRLTAYLLLVCLLLAGCGKENTVPAEETPAVTETPVKIAGETPILQSSENMGSVHGISVTMLNVGQGLSILVQADGHKLLYDGGISDKACNRYLQTHDIDALDYLVVSHYDADHITGLENVLKASSVRTVICPDYELDSSHSTYKKLIAQLEISDPTIVHPLTGDTYALGNAVITVLGPENYNVNAETDENNMSIALKITYGSFSCVLTGDAQRAEELFIAAQGEIVDTDLYVLGHHGSKSSSSEELLDVMNPDFAFLSCAPNNKYSHPNVEVLNFLEQRNVKLFRTDVQGHVTCYSNGERVWFSQLPCDDWSTGSELAEKMPKPEECSYVLNTRSMIFHVHDCKELTGSAEHNRYNTCLSKEEILEMGYAPCGSCKPAEG